MDDIPWAWITYYHALIADFMPGDEINKWSKATRGIATKQAGKPSR